jgi:hypothetical protein
MELDMKGIGRMISNMGKGEKLGMMEANMKVNIKEVKKKVLVYISGMMVVVMKACGKRIK